MIKFLKFLIPTIFFLLLLITPSIVLNGAQKGLLVWFNALIPALLPYMLFSSLMIQSGLSSNMSIIAMPLTQILKIPHNAAYGIMSGLFFGYPACAVNLNLMVSTGQLDKKTAEFCICAFNNISPSYMIGFICIGLFNNSKMAVLILSIFYISLLLSTTIIRLILFDSFEFKIPSTEIISIPTKKLFSSSIKKSLVNIGLLGGYVIIFSIITEYIITLPFDWLVGITPYIEIAGGSVLITDSSLSMENILLILMPALSFGGISGIFQTIAVDTENILDIKKYIYSKLISGVVCLIITCLTVYVLKITI